MSFIDNLSMVKKLTAVGAAGAIGAMSVGYIGVSSHASLAQAANTRADLISAKAALNHLDTRESELKVSAYRSLSEQDVQAISDELKEDAVTVTEAVAAYEKLQLSPALEEGFADIKPKIDDFTTFIVGFVDQAAEDKTAAAARQAEVAERNHIVDDELEALHEKLDKKIEVSSAAEDAEKRQAGILMAVVLAVSLALLAALAFLVTRAITRPLAKVSAVLESLATGDLRQRAAIHSKDELGQMGSALERAIDSVRAAIEGMAGSASQLSNSSDRLTDVTREIGDSATQTSERAGRVSAAADQVSRNVNTVASGAQEMDASIREIAQNASEAASVAGGAVTIAESTNATVTKLRDSSSEIGDVLKVITSIAEQTNLLALNATIEAARAGEAGKGFAVVAGEVKELAQETAKATEDIGRRVEAIQADTDGAVAAIGEITHVITRINDIQTVIAAAVEEQTATTAEMTRNVTEAAAGTSEIASHITEVAGAADSTATGVSDGRRHAEELARMSIELDELVSRFQF